MDFLRVFSVLLSPIQQYKASRLQTKVALYDKRFKVYNSIEHTIGLMIAQGNISLDQLTAFKKETKEASFLFKKEIKDYIEEIYQQALKLHYVKRKLDSNHLPTGEESTRLADKWGELMIWFSDQKVTIENLFSPYLGITVK